MNTSESLDKLAPALVNAQGNMPATTKDGKGYNYTYTTLDQIINKARPVLVANGLVIVQAPVSDNGQLGVTSRLLHESGQWLESTIMAAPDADKQKVAIQAAGSIITYLRRYAYAAILGLADETDTDGVPTPVKPAPGKVEQPPAPPRPEPNVGSTTGPLHGRALLDAKQSKIADARAALEESVKNGVTTLGEVGKCATMTGLYTSWIHFKNTLTPNDETGNEGYSFPDNFKTTQAQKITKDGALVVFDWAVARKVGG